MTIASILGDSKVIAITLLHLVYVNNGEIATFHLKQVPKFHSLDCLQI